VDFSWFDILVVAFILLIGIRGLVNGFIKEVFNLLGLIGGIFLASRFAPNVGKIINENIYAIQNEAAVKLVGFVIILLSFWIFCLIVGLVASKLIILGELTSLNKLFGFIFNCLKTFLIFSVIVFALSNIDFIRKQLDSALENSFMYASLLSVGSKIVNIDIKAVQDNATQIIKDNVTELIFDNADEILNAVEDINITLNPEE
jgi:membrane protein required for colicin V production